jgi:hypothetical protein
VRRRRREGRSRGTPTMSGGSTRTTQAWPALTGRRLDEGFRVIAVDES